jgi:hypothetical protein
MEEAIKAVAKAATKAAAEAASEEPGRPDELVVI